MVTILATLPLMIGQASLDPPKIAPPDFSGAAGFYNIETRALPTEIEVDKPLILIVTITGEGPKEYHPERDKLKIISDQLREDFYVIDFASRDRYYPGQNKWTFHYRLKPKDVDSDEIPPLPFRFWYPRQQKFILRKSEPIDLTVKPAAEVKPPADAVLPLSVPEHLLQLADKSDALQHREPASFPDWAVVAAFLAIPPLTVVIWFWLWRRINPDASRLLQRMKNRAAQRAIDQLRRPHVDADEIAHVFADYLRKRIDVHSQEATADEVLHRLQQLGARSVVRTHFAVYFEHCNTARFSGQNGKQSLDLKTEVLQLIQHLEADPCLDVNRV